MVRSYNTILSLMSNSSLVLTERWFSKASFTSYNLLEIRYSLSLVTFPMSVPVISHTDEFSFIHLLVLSSDAGYTARLIRCVFARFISWSLHPCFSRKPPNWSCSNAWWHIHSEPISRTSLFLMLLTSIF
ncbi:hypothetical protein JCM21142_134792 [Saccharicrinis fermentans DSM 9555 = JCM 21142]|uniref:Uncharacterized protein n=1 Tax=Saccharicrinis fermentans DSM 9555 = JCM 21142 TaxID=869213 RepID=W7Y508_9BACT|nr:hypothetical protein JCM21142_134792 [Saccharicrinis fermentans DSM 9555 = JCM 21142]